MGIWDGIGGAVAGPLVGGLLGGFLGGGQTQQQKDAHRLYKFQMGLADQMRRFAQSVPLSDPGEQAALASQRGLLGEEQGRQTQNLYGQWNLNTAQPGATNDLLGNLSNQQLGQRQALDAQHLIAALGARRNGLLQASQIAGGATSALGRYQQSPDFSSLFGNIARLWSQNNALGQANAQPTYGTVNAGIFGDASGVDQNPYLTPADVQGLR